MRIFHAFIYQRISLFVCFKNGNQNDAWDTQGCAKFVLFLFVPDLPIADWIWTEFHLAAQTNPWWITLLCRMNLLTRLAWTCLLDCGASLRGKGYIYIQYIYYINMVKRKQQARKSLWRIKLLLQKMQQGQRNDSTYLRAHSNGQPMWSGIGQVPMPKSNTSNLW